MAAVALANKTARLARAMSAINRLLAKRRDPYTDIGDRFCSVSSLTALKFCKRRQTNTSRGASYALLEKSSEYRHFLSPFFSGIHSDYTKAENVIGRNTVTQ